MKNPTAKIPRDNITGTKHFRRIEFLMNGPLVPFEILHEIGDSPMVDVLIRAF